MFIADTLKMFGMFAISEYFWKSLVFVAVFVQTRTLDKTVGGQSERVFV